MKEYSFKRIGKTIEDLVVFYSSPNKNHREDGLVEHMKKTITEQGGKNWIWIFNCTELTPKQAVNIHLALGIAELLRTMPGCRGVYVQNSNWAVKKLLEAIKLTLPITLTCRLFVDENPPTFFPIA